MLNLDAIAGTPQEPGVLQSDDDSVLTQAPHCSVPWVEAILGCSVRAIHHGMRSHPIVRDWAEWEVAPRWSDSWFGCLVQLTEMLVARNGGCHAICQTLMRGPADLAEAALESELMCLSMYDHPHQLYAFLETASQVFVRVLHAHLDAIPTIERGYVNPFGLWATGTVVRTQCDTSALLSPSQYEKWFLPFDMLICESFDYAVIHLLSASLHTVDALLKVERPQAIQVTLDPEPSGPRYEALLPTFGRILTARPGSS